VSDETFDARMERLLRTLPPALRGMGFGDPDDVDYAHASDVVAWSIREIDRLREERRWVPVGERLPEVGSLVLAFINGEIMETTFCGGGGLAWQTDRRGFNATHWMPMPPGPEEEANG